MFYQASQIAANSKLSCGEKVENAGEALRWYLIESDFH
jgi:hypothetical protein